MNRSFTRRAIAGLSAAVIMGMALTACSQGAANTATPSTLKLWLPPLGNDQGKEASTWDSILSGFEDSHNVDVQVTVIPWENYEEKYLTGVASGQGPDVGYMYNEMMGDYINKGAIVPFDDYLKEDAAANLLYLKQGQVDGKQYALPFVVGGARVVYANQAILDAAGVTSLPKTWKEFQDAAAKVTASGKTATVQPWGAPDRGMLNSTFFPALWQAGGSLFTADGKKTAFDSPEGLKAATFINDLIKSGAMPAEVTGLNLDDAKQQFYAGKVAFLAESESLLPAIKEAGIDAKIVYSLKDKQQGTFVASDSLVLLKTCKDKQLCTDLVTYLEAGEQMSQLHKFADYPPIGKDEQADPNSPFTDLYSNQTDILNPLPVVAGQTAVLNVLYSNLQQMVLGQKTPAQALKDAAKAGDEALISAG